MANNQKSETSEISIKDAAGKLDISDSTVKKYLKDFSLPMGKGPSSKAMISDETFQALSEIAKLRANGLSIQEIKELKSQEPSKHILDEIEETQTPKEEVKPPEGLNIDEIASLKEDSSYESVTETEVENGIPSESAEMKAEEEISEDSDSETEEPEEGDEESSDTPRRRRGFNYKYVERQISNDSKRVSSMRQRLRNPNLSVQDRLYFEEALERRILFLNGWKHILRWISK